MSNLINLDITTECINVGESVIKVENMEGENDLENYNIVQGVKVEIKTEIIDPMETHSEFDIKEENDEVMCINKVETVYDTEMINYNKHNYRLMSLYNNDIQISIPEPQQAVVFKQPAPVVVYAKEEVPLRDQKQHESCNMDWFKYSPKMLQNLKAPALRRNLSTPSNVNSKSRRRPMLVYQKAEAAILAETRIKTLKACDEHAKEQHAAQMRIFSLQECQEKLKVEQEKVRLLLLQAELRNKTGEDV